LYIYCLQVWFDDAHTMSVKMAAAKQIGLKGVGVWTSDDTMGNVSLAKEMWAAVPAPNKTGDI
jgi:spore germination protein YaaH